MKFKYILTIGLVLSFSALSAQFYSYSQLLKTADAAYGQAHFIKAIDNYQKAMEVNSSYPSEVLFRLGDAAYQSQSMNIAETALTSYLEKEDIPLAGEAIFRLGRIAHLKGDYNQATRQYDLYLSEFSELDPEVTENITFLKTKTDWALTADIQNEIDSVIRLDEKINSNASDNAPFFHDGALYYSSLKFPIEKDKSKRYKSLILKDSEVLDIPGVADNQLLSNPSFNKEGTVMYFSICDYVEVYKINCAIHKADISEDGSITNVTKLPENINQPGSTNSHPSLAEVDGKTTLYFSSTRIGGKGGTDIWEVDVTDYGYGQPANLFSINTKRDELTPFFHNPTKSLYFSSNGQNGFGGHDVFRLLDGSDEPENLGPKLNSSYNDVHYSLVEDGSKGYFSSNRPGSAFADDSFETCCYDIYSSSVKECNIDLKALAYDEETKEPLDGVTVKIYDNTTNEVYYQQLLTTNEMEVKLPCEGDWRLSATREDYNNIEIDLSQLNPVFGSDNTTTEELYMKKDYSKIALTIDVFEEVANRPLEGATIFLTDMSDMSQETITENKSNKFQFDIKSNRDYTLEINKEGFKEKTISFNSGYGDLKMTKEAILSYLDVVQKSIVSLENAIPVSLYFDNDYPDPRTTNNFSSKTYTETFDGYYGRKDKYKIQYLSLFKNSSDKLTANDEVENLFQSHIKRGFDRYDAFKRQLLIVLQAGQDINIYLKGYASPIAKSEYNEALGKRRVDSIRKEFDSWNNRALLPYITSGQLKVTERSFGETTSPAGISDDPNAPSKSIYSPQASLERRVEIEEINIKQ